MTSRISSNSLILDSHPVPLFRHAEEPTCELGTKVERRCKGRACDSLPHPLSQQGHRHVRPLFHQNVQCVAYAASLVQPEANLEMTGKVNILFINVPLIVIVIKTRFQVKGQVCTS
jgi:hypothetical protein